MTSFVRCSVRTIRTSNELAIPSHVACGGERRVDSRRECDEPLGRSLGGERVDLRMAQRRKHLSVGCERPSEATDSTASVAE
jgi:hypothetical protein